MALPRGFLWLVLFALVGAQTLGLMHRVVHVPDFETEVAAVRDHGNGSHDHPWTESLFGGHDGEPDCRLFDQLSQGGCLPAMAALPPVIAPLFFLQWFQGEAVARWAALFDARGPPELR